MQTSKDRASLQDQRDEEICPGLVVVFSRDRPYLSALPLRDGRIELGRSEMEDLGIADERISRRHLALQTGGDGRLVVRDAGSTNGVFLDGRRICGEVAVAERAVLRVGRTILLLVPDVTPYQGAADRPMVRDGFVIGPALHALHAQVATLARSGQGLFLRGESGAGKEMCARIHHQAGPRSGGPLVAVNCAAIPRDLAERLLFGTVRGAYSGAVADAPGYLQAASGGTLFLDEIAELDRSVQPKLLRALETHEVTPLGATRPQPIDLGLCTATLRDLRQAVRQGSFREDLYYRVGLPEVRLPPLRDRPEEIPFLIAEEARAAARVAEPSLVETCLLRRWPGNVRELRAEVRTAAARAAAQGSEVVLSRHLDDYAGLGLAAAEAIEVTLSRWGLRPQTPAPAEAVPPPAPAVPKAQLRAASEALGLAHKTVLKLLPPEVLLSCSGAAGGDGLGEADQGRLLRARTSEALLALLSERQYNQSEVAAALGTSRTTLIRLMDDLGVPRAGGLGAEEVTRALDRAAGHLDAAARLLGVSAHALKLRLAQLDPKPRN